MELKASDIKGMQDQAGMVDFSSSLVEMKQNAQGIKGVFDSAEMGEMISNEAPPVLQEVLGKIPSTGGHASGQAMILNAIFDGVKEYELRHGCKPRGDILENAIRGGLVVLDSSGLKNAAASTGVWDNAYSTGSGSAMQVNRAAISIYQAIAENVVPFAGYIPMNEGLEGRIIILQHEAGSTCGGYKENESMDGVNIGKPYMSTARYVPLTDNSGTWEGFAAYADDDTAGVPIIPSATEVYVDGESVLNAPNHNERLPDDFTIGGRVEINGATHAATCVGKATTGAVKVSFTPVLPAGVEVEALLHIDYEKPSMKEKRPRFNVEADMCSFRATFLTGLYRNTQEAKIQFRTEVQTDTGAQAMVAIRSQAGVETVNELVPRMYKLAAKYTSVVDLHTTTRLDERGYVIDERGYVSIWADVAFKLAEADVEMAVRTHGVGIKYIYVSRKGRANLLSLPPALFEKAPLFQNAIGHQRLGRLFGQYEVYFLDGCVAETPISLEMLLIGGADQTALNPAIIGEVSGAIVPLGVENDLSEGIGFIQARAALVNKFKRSAQAVAKLQVINLL